MSLALLSMLAIVCAGGAQAQQSQKPAAQAPAICIAMWDPVCARTRKGVLATFSNASCAAVAGAKVVAKGACPQVACTMIWLPVCGRKAGANKTYANACSAELDGAVVLSPGECPEVCTKEVRPVCAVNDVGKRDSYSNRCMATLAGARTLHNGKCLDENAPCIQVRTCAIDPATKKPRWYPTPCDAQKANATVVPQSQCKGLPQ